VSRRAVPHTVRMLRKLLLLALTAAYAWVIWRMTLTPHVFTSAENSLVLHAIAWAQHLPHGSWLTYDRTEGIELAQGALLPYRVSDPRDVLSNGLGGLLGATLVGFVRSLLPAPRSRRLRARTV
jgi:hypothetical protein